jgi:hypothetical protein
MFLPFGVLKYRNWTFLKKTEDSMGTSSINGCFPRKPPVNTEDYCIFPAIHWFPAAEPCSWPREKWRIILTQSWDFWSHFLLRKRTGPVSQWGW